RVGGVLVHGRDLLHRVDPDPGRAAAVDDRHGDLVERGRALEAVEGLAAGQLRDPLGHRGDAATGAREDQLPLAGRLDGERAPPAAPTGLDPYCLVLRHALDLLVPGVAYSPV